MPKGYSTAWGDRPYAENTQSGPRWTGRVELIESQLEIPLHWRKPRRIFVNSMSDSFHEALPFEHIKRIWDVTARANWHTYMILTKRAKRMLEFSRWMAGADDVSVAEWPRNVHLGVSIEDRSQLHRIDKLRKTPAALRFLSLEPLLEDLGELDLRGIGWVIVGGESGPGARGCDVQWIRSIVRQCRAQNIPCFVKQTGTNTVVGACRQQHFEWGEGKFEYWQADTSGLWRVKLLNRKGGDPSEWPADLRVREIAVCRLGDILQPLKRVEANVSQLKALLVGLIARRRRKL
jgi:protein gp37